MKILGVAAALFVGLVVFNMAKQKAASSEPAVPPGLSVLSVSCDPNYGRPRADVAVRNLGGEVRSPKAYVSFGGKVFDGHIRPWPLPAGSIGTATIYANKGDSASCSLESVQDGDGVSASLSH